MASAFDCPIFSSNIKGGDIFILKDTDKKVQAIAPNESKTIVDTNFKNVWVKDEKLTKVNRDEFQTLVDDWSGR